MPTPSFTLKKLSLRSFRSVVEEQVVPLPTQGMHLLLGPSGAGKTTIGEGIAFALGYSNFSATDLQSWDWLTKEPLRDVLELETTKGSLRITRGNQASILMPGEKKPRTSAKALVEGIEQALGISPAFLEVLTYRSQKAPGLFLSMADSTKKSFLTRLLGLDTFEQAAEKAVKNTTALTEAVDRAQVKRQTLLASIPIAPEPPQFLDLMQLAGALVEAEAEVVRLSSVLDGTKALDRHLTEQQAARVEAVKNHWRPKLGAAKAVFENLPVLATLEYERDLAKVRQEQTQHVQLHRREVSLVEKELESTIQFQNAMAALAAKKPEAKSRLLHAEADRDQIAASGKCYTCMREWPDDENKVEALARCDADIAAQKKIIGEADIAEAQALGFAQAIHDTRERLAGLKSINPVPPELVEKEQKLVGDIASAKAERDAYSANARAEFHRLAGEAERAIQETSAMTSEEEQVRRTLGDLANALTGATQRVASARQTVAAARRENELTKSHYEQAAAQYNKHAGSVMQAALEVNAAEGALAQEKDFLGMVRGFLAYIFDETLARIADATNARLALIPNVADLTLRFASERETGTGKLRQEIVAVCEKNGHTIPLKAGTSGGMYSAVELAVDLSLADVIAERTGVYPGWLILDEAFEGLDTPCKTACFEMLKSISQDRAVFVVDHACEMQELFDSRIRIDFDGSRSRVVLL